MRRGGVGSCAEDVYGLGPSESSATVVSLRPVGEIFEHNTLLGLGEATHGTREFFQFKHRLIRYLVTEHGLRTVGLEANVAETDKLNEYVTSGAGEPRALLKNVYYWVWDTESVLAFLEWLRSFNENRAEDEMVELYGFDCQFTRGAGTVLRSFLRQTDVPVSADLRDSLALLEENDVGMSEGVALEHVDSVRRAAERVDVCFREFRDVLLEVTSDREWRRLQRYRRSVDQAVSIATARAKGQSNRVVALRDTYMAENILRRVSREGHGTSVLWAHNGHVKTGQLKGSTWQQPDPSMGQHLQQWLGDEYFALGMELVTGAYRAFPGEMTGSGRELEVFRTNELPSDAVAHLIDDFDGEVGMVDFDRVSPGLFGQLLEERRIHNIGSVCPLDPESRLMSVRPASVFDGMVFVDDASPSVLIDRSS